MPVRSPYPIELEGDTDCRERGIMLVDSLHQGACTVIVIRKVLTRNHFPPRYKHQQDLIGFFLREMRFIHEITHVLLYLSHEVIRSGDASLFPGGSLAFCITLKYNASNTLQ